MRFRFRFEALLTYRAHVKEKAEISLGQARKRLRDAQEELARLHERHLQGALDLAQSIQGRSEAGLLKSYADYLQALKHRMAVQVDEIERREQDVKKCLAEVMVRTREFKVIEKLNERDYHKWLHEQRLQEQKILDENAVIRHGRAFL
jgi:flagellar FliJ protein